MDLTSLMSPDTPEQPPSFLSKVMGDPWFRMGMALLEQGGPQAHPHSVGQDISRAVGTVQGQQDADLMRQQQAVQMQNAQRMQKFSQQMMPQIMGGSNSQPQGPMMPPPAAQMISPNTAPMPQARPQAGQYDAYIDKAARQAGVDPALFRSLVQSESNFQQTDPRTGKPLTSKAGAIGLAQLMPGTARELGVDPNDPEQNLMGGARYLAQMQKMFGNDRDALRAYNAGPKNARMSPTISSGYADTIQGRLPQAAAKPNPMAPRGVPPSSQPAPAPQMDTSQPGGGLVPPNLPPDLKQLFLVQAYAQSNGDTTQFMANFLKNVGDWQKSQSEFGNKLYEDAYKAGIDRANQDANNRQQAALAGPKAWDEADAKANSENYQTLQKAGQAANDTIANYKTLGQLLDMGGYQGSGGSTVQWLRKAAVSVGALDKDAAAAVSGQDAATSIINKLTLDARSTANGGGMPGAMSDPDREFLSATIANIDKLPNANKAIIELAIRMARRQQDIAKMARQYRKDNGGKFDDGFQDVLQKYSDSNPLFTKDDMQRILGGGQQPAAQGAPTLTVGQVVDGFRFKGGDPKQQSNWEAVK